MRHEMQIKNYTNFGCEDDYKYDNTNIEYEIFKFEISMQISKNITSNNDTTSRSNHT